MQYKLNGNSRVDFTAYAPLHTFKGWAEDGFTGSATVDFASLRMQHIEAALQTLCFETGDAERNKAMKDFFSLEKHPQTSFVMTECREFQQAAENSYRITVLGILDFAGIRRQLPLCCTLEKEPERLLCNLKFTWSFKAYGLKAPRLLFLTLRDIVHISACLEFTTP